MGDRTNQKGKTDNHRQSLRVHFQTSPVPQNWFSFLNKNVQHYIESTSAVRSGENQWQNMAKGKRVLSWLVEKDWGCFQERASDFQPDENEKLKYKNKPYLGLLTSFENSTVRIGQNCAKYSGLARDYKLYRYSKLFVNCATNRYYAMYGTRCKNVTIKTYTSDAT